MIMVEKNSRDEMVVCPVGRFFMDMEGIFGKKSKISEHMVQARIEFLKGIRSWVDDRIDHLEKSRRKAGKKITKIKVD
jgi:hypothetical protein